MDALAVLLSRPIPDIAALVGLLVVVILAVGFAVYLVFRGMAYLHIKKIGVTGIECETDARSKRKRRKPCANS